MEPVGPDELRSFLSRSGIKVADPSTGVGQELSYAALPSRTIVVHLVEADPENYVRDVVQRILDMDEAWLLIPRYESAGYLEFAGIGLNASAIRFSGMERQSLSSYLRTRPTPRGPHSADVYALSGSGQVLLTWDHHTAEDGLGIDFSRISDASRLLVSLNELGAELEVFYTTPD